jgi:Uncharacterized protein conserved in bacteria
MFTKLLRIIFILAFMGCGFAAITAQAQEEIAPQKRELIREMLQITNAQINANQLLDSLLLQEELAIPEHVARELDRQKSLSPEEREKLRAEITEKSLRIFTRLRELLPQRINFAQEMDKISYPIYDKYFTESDLKELVAFYKSPVGKKSLEVMPKMMLDVMKQAQEVFMPKVKKAVDEVMAEEEKRLKASEKPAAKPE